MSTETAKTTEQEQWVLVRSGLPSHEPVGTVQIVLATSQSSVDVDRAKRDPANVLNVAAYPGVVEALTVDPKGMFVPMEILWGLIIEAEDSPLASVKQMAGVVRRMAEQLDTALAAVHPVANCSQAGIDYTQGDKA